MRHTMLVLLLATVSVAAPPPKDKPAPYFPTVVGDKLVYERLTDGKEEYGDVTDRVMDVEKKDGVIYVTIQRIYPETEGFRRTIAVADSGLFQVVSRENSLTSASPILKLPPKEGTTWEWKTETTKITFTVIREEEVTVPAGKFKAIRVEMVTERDDPSTFWFAPAVGMVKMSALKGSHTLALKEFKAGK
ncbi:hypothetical protein [Zavarzinella formosa]|uniref:hypothetical protein n=1 Tax=Zavarzinella formosa TaxID=360055 RepID=UPI0012F9B337|nr:hypothetical protein [Zavarzinella formosa]